MISSLTIYICHLIKYALISFFSNFRYHFYANIELTYLSFELQVYTEYRQVLIIQIDRSRNF